MTSLVQQLKQKMHKDGLTAYSLEKHAGLKPNAVHNIISGRSKNPSINVLQTIAKTLNCTVSDLIGEDSNDQTKTLQQESLNAASSSENTFEDKELYINCLLHFGSLLKKHKCWLEKSVILNCVDELYLYSFNKGNNKVDIHFAKWFFERVRN